jgi:Transcriptional regulator, Out at first
MPLFLRQEICFILPIEPGEFISSDAMSKLRQKNPHTIRRAEEELPKANFSMNHLVSQVSLAVLPRSVQELCSSMEVQTFAQSFDLLKWSVNDGPTGTTWSSGPCNATVSWNKACLCSYPLCVVWYPCDLKYCKSEQAGTDQLEYRCGIKTCAKCRIFTFEVRKKMDCLWNLIP